MMHLTAVLSVFMFFASVPLSAMLLMQKRRALFCLSLGLSALCYALEQYLAGRLLGGSHAQTGISALRLPMWAIVVLCAIASITLTVGLWRVYLYERRRVTPMSVKEAMDSLPAGMLCFAPGGQILLCNASMSALSLAVTGEEPVNGEAFCNTLLSGPLPQGCTRIPLEGEAVYALPDGSAWKTTVYPLLFEKREVHMLLSLNVSEVYRQTQRLERMRADLAALEERLKQVNREIVALTAEREMLNTRVKIHDELGTNLLAIKRLIAVGGEQEERRALMERLRLNLSFLQAGTQASAADEYELLMRTAQNLGLQLEITGVLPGEEPLKRILATAIHECVTNTLRHAHGDRLQVSISESPGRLRAVFTNNGLKPDSPIRETGGLLSLRRMVEDAGGSMKIETVPTFELTVELQKGKAEN